MECTRKFMYYSTSIGISYQDVTRRKHSLTGLYPRNVTQNVTTQFELKSRVALQIQELYMTYYTEYIKIRFSTLFL